MKNTLPQMSTLIMASISRIPNIPAAFEILTRAMNRVKNGRIAICTPV